MRVLLREEGNCMYFDATMDLSLSLAADALTRSLAGQSLRCRPRKTVDGPDWFEKFEVQLPEGLVRIVARPETGLALARLAPCLHYLSRGGQSLKTP